MRRVAAGLSVLLAICAAATSIGAGASAAATEVPHGVERVTIYLHSPTQPHRRELIISVYPLEGEATASSRRDYFQPGTRAACSIHPVISSLRASSRVRTLT